MRTGVTTRGRSLLTAVVMAATCLMGAPQAGTLKPAGSEAALAERFRHWAETLAQRDAMRYRASGGVANEMATQMAPPAAPSPALAAKSAAAADESVTNNQVAGVDEGGIVKLHRDHLLILRRGRLFTVDLRGDRLRPIAAVDAYGRGIDPRGAWYDELLVSGDTAVVIGYSYARGGTEIGLFDLAADGGIAHRATYHLKSNDYYSSRNYASRLVGTKLVFYAPLAIDPRRAPREQLPGLREWREGAERDDFAPTTEPARIYLPPQPLDPLGGLALHTVTVCDLAAARMRCDSTAVLGAPGRVFHVAGEAVYVWTAGRGRGGDVAPALVYRLPLDGSAPQALAARGAPIDTFSFLEREGRLHVLLRDAGRGEGMWGAESRRGSRLALMTLPVERFASREEVVPAEAYRVLPGADGAVVDRYVGETLLYATAPNRRPRPDVRESTLQAVRLADGQVFAITLPHAVERIEAAGRDAIVIGASDADLGFSTIRLARVPVAAGHYRRAGAAQAESRSHGFFYKPDDDFSGLVGLPVFAVDEAPRAHGRRTPAALLLLRHHHDGRFDELGTLDASAGGAKVADECRASCVDWYGNARPLFVRGRVFALLGYEIVEGRLRGGAGAERIEELRRVSFAPGRVGGGSAPAW